MNLHRDNHNCRRHGQAGNRDERGMCQLDVVVISVLLVVVVLAAAQVVVYWLGPWPGVPVDAAGIGVFAAVWYVNRVVENNHAEAARRYEEAHRRPYHHEPVLAGAAGVRSGRCDWCGADAAALIVKGHSPSSRAIADAGLCLGCADAVILAPPGSTIGRVAPYSEVAFWRLDHSLLSDITHAVQRVGVGDGSACVWCGRQGQVRPFRSTAEKEWPWPGRRETVLCRGCFGVVDRAPGGPADQPFAPLVDAHGRHFSLLCAARNLERLGWSSTATCWLCPRPGEPVVGLLRSPLPGPWGASTELADPVLCAQCRSCWSTQPWPPAARVGCDA